MYEKSQSTKPNLCDDQIIIKEGLEPFWIGDWEKIIDSNKSFGYYETSISKQRYHNWLSI